MKKLALTALLFFNLVCLVGAANDPDAVADQARQRVLQALPGTYQIEGFLNTDVTPRAKPDYSGTMVIRKNGQQFDVTYQWKGGSAKGVGVLDLGQFVGDGYTEANVRFRFSVGTLNASSQLGVTQYRVLMPSADERWELSGPWRSGGTWGYEHAVKNP